MGFLYRTEVDGEMRLVIHVPTFEQALREQTHRMCYGGDWRFRFWYGALDPESVKTRICLRSPTIKEKMRPEPPLCHMVPTYRLNGDGEKVCIDCGIRIEEDGSHEGFSRV